MQWTVVLSPPNAPNPARTGGRIWLVPPAQPPYFTPRCRQRTTKIQPGQNGAGQRVGDSRRARGSGQSRHMCCTHDRKERKDRQIRMYTRTGPRHLERRAFKSPVRSARRRGVAQSKATAWCTVPRGPSGQQPCRPHPLKSPPSGSSPQVDQTRMSGDGLIAVLLGGPEALPGIPRNPPPRSDSRLAAAELSAGVFHNAKERRHRGVSTEVKFQKCQGPRLSHGATSCECSVVSASEMDGKRRGA